MDGFLANIISGGALVGSEMLMDDLHIRAIKAHLRRKEAKSLQGWKVC
jgi:hypothetical protein